ncbi:MAG: hypothetical protein ACI9OJ_001323, partial [Myxococcota bacterium]
MEAAADGSDFDLGFDLDGLVSNSGASAAGAASAAGPSTALGADTGNSAAGFALGGGGESGFEVSDFSFEDSRASESSAFGFDGPQEQTGEISALQDVDLTLVGTYHRTGRKLHHATDVVWTGQRGGDPSATKPEPVPEPVRAARPPRIPADETGVFRAVAPRPTPELSVGGQDGFTSLEASVAGQSGGLSDFESLPPSMPLADLSITGERFSQVGGSNEPSLGGFGDSAAGAFGEGVDSVIGGSAAAG